MAAKWIIETTINFHLPLWKINLVSESDQSKNKKSSGDIGHSLMFQKMQPQVRECDPRAYFRARLSSLKEAREILLVEEEYAEERQEVFKSIVRPHKHPPLIYPVLLFFIAGGFIGTGYGLYIEEASMVVGFVPATLYAIWLLRGQQRHYRWLHSFSIEQRTEIIDYLKNSHLIDESEQRQMLSELDIQQ